MNGLVVLNQLIPQILNPHIPGIYRPVDQGGIGPLAEGIAVLKRILVHQGAFFLEPPDDGLVGILAELPFVLGANGGEVAFCIEVVREGDIRLLAYPVVILAECGGNVHQAGAVLG